MLNKRTIESLIKAGAFDSLGHTRRGLMEAFESMLDNVITRRRAEDMGQYSLFGGDVGVDEVRIEIAEVEWPKKTRLSFEKEMLSRYVSDHPLLGVETLLRTMCTTTIPGLWEQEDKSRATVGGTVSAITRRFTKSGDPMYFFVLEDLRGSTEVMCFPRVVAEYGPLIRDDVVLVVTGRVDHKGDDVKLIAQELREPDLTPDSMVRLRVPATRLSQNMVAKLRGALSNHPGSAQVFIHMMSDNGEKVIKLGDEHRVEPRSALFAELRELLGPSAVL